MQPFEGTILQHDITERTIVTGKMDDRNAVLAALHEDDFRTVSSGPYTDGDMWPKHDLTRFKIGAERVIPYDRGALAGAVFHLSHLARLFARSGADASARQTEGVAQRLREAFDITEAEENHREVVAPVAQA